MAHSTTSGECRHVTISRLKYRIVAVSFIFLVLIVVLVLFCFIAACGNSNQPAPNAPPSFFASVDTMKASGDTSSHPLSTAEITNIVNLSASINTNYITVATMWDYPTYMQQWIDAIRATGRHIWFRSHPNQWEDDNGTSGIMTPAEYESTERNFILAHPSFFQAGDILDPCPEAENGLYWPAQYGQNWSWNAPNTATREYNAFLRDTTDVADAALHQKGIYGVITTIHSTNPFIATHPDVLEQATVTKMGHVTVDSYPDQYTTDPVTAASLRVSELNTIENTWHVPIVIGEMGYSNSINVDDATQQAVLKAEFAAIAPLSYVVGLNYWVGPGTDTSGGYTHIFVKSNGTWSLRPAAFELSQFYKTKLQGMLSTPTSNSQGNATLLSAFPGISREGLGVRWPIRTITTLLDLGGNFL